MKKTEKRNTRNRPSPKRNLKNVVFYLFFGSLITLLPFVYYRNGLDPALHPRLLFLSILLVFGSVFIFWIKRKTPFNYSILQHKIFYFLTAYFVFTTISVFFAINPREGNYDINKTFAILTLVAVSAILFSNTEKWFRFLPILVFVPAITFIIIGVLEYYNNVFLSDARYNVQNLPMIYEVRGFMAHKNQFTMAMMMTLPFLGFGIYAYKGAKRLISVLLLGLLLGFIIILKTRSVWVGLSGAITVAVFLIVFFGNQLKLKKQIRRIIGISFLFVLITLSGVVYFSKTQNADSIIFKLKRIANPVDKNNIHRLYIWDITTKMIKDHSMQGVGAGNWKINSPYYYPGYNFGKQQLNWLRPHNDYLWVFSEKGIFGFLSFIGIFLLAGFYLIKIFFSSIDQEKKVFALFMLGGLISYLSVSFFTFPLERMNHQIYLAIILGAAITLYHEKYGNAQKTIYTKFLPIPIILILGYSIVYSISVLEMEAKIKKARVLQERGQWKQMLDLSETIPATFRTIDSEAMPVAWYRGLSHANLNQIEQANLAYQEARIAHPTRIAVLNNLGRTYFQLNEYENARDIFIEALVILPEYFEALVNLSACYIQLEDYENAYKYLRKIPKKKRNKPLKRNLRFVRKKLIESGKLPAKKNNNQKN